MPLVQPTRRPEIAWRVIEDEAVVVNPHTGQVYPFNPVGACFWQLADGTHTFDQIVAIIVAEFDAPQEQVRADLSHFMQQLGDSGLIHLGTLEGQADTNGRL